MKLHNLAAGEGASFASSACHDQSSSSDEAGAPQLTFPLPLKNFEEWQTSPCPCLSCISVMQYTDLPGGTFWGLSHQMSNDLIMWKLIRLIDKMWVKQFAFVSILEWNLPVLCCYPTGEGTILSIWTTTKDLGKRLRLTLIFGSKLYRSFSVVWWVPWLKKMGGFNLKWFSNLKRWIYRGFTFFGT